MVTRRILPAAMTLVLAMFASRESRSQLNSNPVDYGVYALDYSRVGTSGWQFLKLPSNARSTAMGGVRAALGYGDASSAFMNPASTADVKGLDVHFSTMKWVADIQYSGASIVKNMEEWGTFGVNLIYVNYGDMVRTEIGEFNGQPGVVAVTQGLGTFSAHDMAIGITYARQVTEKLQLGGNIRYLEEQLDDAKMKGWGIDIGTLYWTGLGSLRISMLGRNFGPDGEYTTFANRIAQAPAKVRMPMMFVLGVAVDIIQESKESDQRLTLTAEYVKPNDGLEKVNAGVEYFLFHNIYFRGGYKFNYDEEAYSFGLGAEYSLEDVLLRFDYAYANLGRLNSVNMLTVGVGF